MSTLYITEYQDLARDSNGNIIPVGQEPPVAYQKVTFTGTRGDSAAFNGKTNFIRVSADAASFHKIAPTATAIVTATGTPMAANTAEYFGVKPTHIISIIA